MLADRFLPDPDVTLVRSIPVDADPSTTYDAILEARVSDDPLLGAVTWLRTLPSRILDLFESTPAEGARVEAETVGDLLASASCRPLAEEPDEELVVGVTGRFWDPRDPDLDGPGAEAFRAFAEPDRAKGLLSFGVHGRGEDRSLLVLELRASGTDPDARRALERFTSFVRPAAALLAQRALKAVQATAEAAETGAVPALPAEPSRADIAAASGQLPTIDDLDVEDRRVLLHADLDADPPTGDAEAGSPHATAGAVERLLDRDAGVVVLGHRTQPGDTPGLEQIAERLAELVGREVTVVPDLDHAAKAAGKVAPGDVLLVEAPGPQPRSRALDQIVELTEAVDAYVNDAFAASHREDPVFAVAERRPGAVGPAVVREMAALDRVGQADEPRVAPLGGTHVDLSLDAIGHLLATDEVDEVLASGLVGLLFLEADGHDTGEGTRARLREHGGLEALPYARNLIDTHRDALVLPEDVVVDRADQRLDVPVGDLPARGRIQDVGPDTVNVFASRVQDAGALFVHGPAGAAEDPDYRRGTHGLLDQAAQSPAYTVVTGPETVAAMLDEGLDPARFDHVSRAGPASLAYLADQAMPGFDRLRPER